MKWFISSAGKRERVIERDGRGFILSGPDLKNDGRCPQGWILERNPFLLETNVPDIFPPQMCVMARVKWVASGVGEGAIQCSLSINISAKCDMADHLLEGSSALRDALRQVPLLVQLREEQLQWLALQGTDLWLQPGDRIATQGDPPDGFYIILEGQTEWRKQVGQQEVYAIALSAGTIFAELILLLDAPYPTSGYALTAVRLFKLKPDAFWNMLSICPSVLRGIVATAVQRSQLHEAVSQEHAKLVSLGTMAAGLAHELNNPAAAARRAVDGLLESFEESQSLAFKLQEGRVISSQCLAEVGYEVQERAKTAPALDALEQSDREQEIASWLEAHGVEDGWQMAPTLAGAGLDVAWLDSLAAHSLDGQLRDLLRWIGATLTTRNLVDQVKVSTKRISTLVKAVKEYSFMDQAPLQEVDVHEGLENTLVILGYKLKKGDIVVTREYDQSLPRVCAYGSKLNQVWTNLIDNAIDALGGSGHIWIRTFQEADRVVVEIADNGPGIPPEVQPRIFEPFFTTKGVGQGTGLGLDISFRVVVGQHKGDIRVFSKPGNTHFQVRLPINPAKITQQEAPMNPTCNHLNLLKEVTPSKDGCEECLVLGDRWVHLRICQVCGHVGCCDSSKNKHSTKHFHSTNHPIIKSFEPGEDWGWCYIDKTYI